MVDNAWRDSFVVKVKSRVAREEDHPISHDSHDNSSLLELEKKANLVKPSGGGEDDPFAGTYFQTVSATGQAKLISKGLSITAQNSLNPEPVLEEVIDPIANESTNKQRRGKSIYNRATQVLNEFAERLSSGGENGVRRKSSKDEDLDRDKSTEGSDRRKSAAPHRVKSVVSKLSRVSRRFAKQDPEEESDETADTTYSSTNPQFAAGAKSIPEIPKSECDTISSGMKE